MSYNTLMQEQQPETPWQFNDTAAPEDPSPAPAPPTRSSQGAVEWSASEFVAHQKGAGWYLLLALATGAVAGLVLLVSGDWIATGVIIFAGILFGIVAARQPRVLQYRVDHDGLHVQDKLYHYGNFKSFAVIEEDAIHSVILMPMKRFMPAMSIYYAPEDEHKIVEALADYLPLQPAENDLIDRLLRKIRF